MANFTTTHHITLLNVTVFDGQLSWLNQTNAVRTATITDVGGDGILTRNVESYISDARFSGFYVSVGGQHFGIFNKGTVWVIPYNDNQLNLGSGVPIASEITAGSTALYTNALHTAANCFLTGTQIATPFGGRPIETLQPGDLILTATGAAIPVLWVWHQQMPNITGVGEGRAPIRIAAHALGPGCPERDLMLTADHALWVDGFLIHAGALVNGRTIRPVSMTEMPASFGYWHIETEAHSLIMAENCPVESFLPYTARFTYDSHAAYLAQHGHDRIIRELPLARIGAARLVPAAIRARLGMTRAA